MIYLNKKEQVYVVSLHISTEARCCYDGYGGRSSCGYNDGIWLDGMRINSCWGYWLELFGYIAAVLTGWFVSPPDDSSL